MSKAPINWMGDSRPTSGSTAGAFRELERSRDIEVARQRLALRTARPGDTLFAAAWKTFAAAFVVMMLATQVAPWQGGPDVVREAKTLADPILTSSH